MNAAWSAWLILIVVTFAIMEGFAFKTNRTTLSRYVVNASKAWPVLPFVLGNVTGGLAVHFWWPWCPALGIGNG